MSDKYFCNCPQDGFSTHATAKEAEDSANESISLFRDEANEGWSSEVDQICWGEIKQESSIFDVKPITVELRSKHDLSADVSTYCDYKLVDVIDSQGKK